ncbi:hypothetical protein AGMMS4956_11330 [Bacteroidia bacterium]|nr:hypothetical protein AGMMS4956_11330 [Bacteroidia bacterium]
MKKLFILAAALLLTCNAFAEIHTWDCGYCGEDYSCPPTNSVTATLNTADSTLTITGTGAMAAYSTGPSASRTSINSIKTVVINNGVTSIGRSAFSSCSSLTSITIPNSVTSIGDAAFLYCSGLTEVTIPNSVTSIGSSAFSSCSGLTEVTIPNSVTSIGSSAFSSCSGLTSVTIGNSVTSIESSAFSGCSGLTSVTIPNSVTSIENFAFWGCSGLTSVTIGNSVTSIEERAFEGCSGLTAINVNNANTRYSSIDGVFYNKAQDTVILCPAGKQGSVTIPNSVTSIGNSAFIWCSGLTSITIPNSVTSIGNYAFEGTAWYNNQPDGVVYAGKVLYKYKGTMPANTSITVQEGTLEIAGGAFSGCSGLTSVTIPNSVTSIGDMAFYYCRGLTSVTIGNSVTALEIMLLPIAAVLPLLPTSTLCHKT